MKTDDASQKEKVRLIENELENIWEDLSTDEKMTNHELERRFAMLRHILQSLKDVLAGRLDRSILGKR